MRSMENVRPVTVKISISLLEPGNTEAEMDFSWKVINITHDVAEIGRSDTMARICQHTSMLPIAKRFVHEIEGSPCKTQWLET